MLDLITEISIVSIFRDVVEGIAFGAAYLSLKTSPPVIQIC
jgi:hypothetical protein